MKAVSSKIISEERLGPQSSLTRRPAVIIGRLIPTSPDRAAIKES